MHASRNASDDIQVDILVTSWQPMNDPNTWEYTVAGRLYAAAALAGLNAYVLQNLLRYGTSFNERAVS